MDIEAQPGARSQSHLDAAAHADNSREVIGSAEQSELAERLRDGLGAGAAVELHPRARRDKRTDFGFGRLRVEQEIIVDGVALSAERGFGAAALQLHIADLV